MGTTGKRDTTTRDKVTEILNRKEKPVFVKPVVKPVKIDDLIFTLEKFEKKIELALYLSNGR
mgnify:CR=1 FL=1